ncbi:MAG: MopE-related protein, partial [bacterium]
MDGFGDAAAPEFACTAGPGTADNPDDCDDADPFVSPDGVELCNEVDDDCDGETDEGLRSRYYRDVDGDTYGDDAGAIDACERPDGTATRGGDCDDTDFSFFPGAPETDCTDPADYNCDGTVGYADADADGYPACVECDDASADVSPAAAEVCTRGIDDDCDGLADDADPSVDLSTAAWYYEDADADGFGDASAPLLACDAPAGFVADDTDCDDATATRFPGAPEVCNSGIDDDC